MAFFLFLKEKNLSNFPSQGIYTFLSHFKDKCTSNCYLVSFGAMCHCIHSETDVFNFKPWQADLANSLFFSRNLVSWLVELHTYIWLLCGWYLVMVFFHCCLLWSSTDAVRAVKQRGSGAPEKPLRRFYSFSPPKWDFFKPTRRTERSDLQSALILLWSLGSCYSLPCSIQRWYQHSPFSGLNSVS